MPEKFNGKVKLTRRVRSDLPFLRDCIAEPGIYDAYVNPHGAVSVIASDGGLLGVKPDEFEWVEKPEAMK
jgi:hypothetical protein